MTLIDDLRQLLAKSEASEARSTAILGGFFNTQLSADILIREQAAQNVESQNLIQSDLFLQIGQLQPQSPQNNNLRNALIILGVLLII